MTPADDPPPGGQEKRRLKPTQGHWGRRKRRLRRVAWLLFGVALAALSIGIVIYRATRPEVRRPGEKLDDITQRLSRGLPQDAPEPRFTDVTDEAGLGDFVSFVGQRSSQLPEDMGSGVAWGDFDNDGDDDAFLVSAGGTLMLPAADWAASQLYENLGDATFRRVESFPELRISGMAAAWGDYNGDGWLDLVVTGYRSLVLFRNDRGRLLKDPALPELPGYWAGASWGDFDNDRDLDLYVCGYVIYVEDTTAAGGGASEQYGTSVPYTLNPASFEPESNLLFQNNGDGTFTEVAQLWGVSNPGGRSLGALWQDFDDDGRLDLYVANDISDNALFLNRGETFEDVSLAAWVADYRGAMGLATGDWNRDGDDDLFVTHWVAQENALYDSRLVDLQRARQLDAPRVDGDPAPALPLSFSDMAAPLGLGQIALQSVGWGTEFVDFDHDGWLDLVVANGSTLETDEVPKALKPQATMILWNRRGEYFHDLAPLNEIFSTPRVSRGLAVSDYDQDGDLDLLFMDLYDRARLLRNDMASGNWLQIRLRSKGSGGELTGRGEGSKVLVRIADLELRRTVTGGSYLSQSSPTLHFGLGRATRVDRVEVRWHGGESQSFAGLEGNTAWELTEGEPAPRRIFGNSGPKTGLAADESSEVSDRQRVLAFWEKQRAAMDAFKIEQDIPKAALLFAEALELDPGHEDSRYYLANCLAVQGEVEEAMRHLERLMEINPLSHRAYKQWGVMRAMTAESPADLDAANRALERSLEINKEETGALLVLGELALMQGDEEVARQRLEWNTSTNPRSTGGFFLQGYLAWQRGESDLGADFLQRAKGTRGADWKPEGTVAEGDVASRMHREASPLSVFWERWDGNLDPSQAFQPLAAFLDQDQPWK